MSIKRKFKRGKSKYTLSQKIVSAVTAAGFIMQPIVGFANNISKVDVNNGTIDIKGDVTHIWADRVVDNTAVNVFQNFQLDAGKIANMYFGLKDTSHNSDNLVNFVNTRIDINGTVNAIQNSQIGGNLFFLSKDGMAVGKSGVINTGSLYVMTPTADFMDSIKTVGGTADAGTAAENLAHITNITTDANAWQAIPVNTSGTITVLGQVNATNEVQMRAAKIAVGKNNTESAIGDIAADAIVNTAYIKTGVTDFGDFVKLTPDQRKEVGLTTLTATADGSGDIVLSAYVDGANKENKVEDLPVVGGTLGTIAEDVENNFIEQEFDASVDVYGTVETTGEKGAIDINATAINSNADYNEKINDYELNTNDVAQLAKVKADVNIGGTVKAADDVTVKAEAVNRYIDNSGGFGTALNLAVGSATPLTGDAAYSVLDTEANVNITSDGSVESTEGNVDIDAKAETLAASAASTTGLKFKTAGGTTGANVPAVAVVYTDVDNKAKVTIEGNVKAAKDISIDADADMKVEAENKMSLMGKEANQFVVGVTVANADNSAVVDIKKDENNSNVNSDTAAIPAIQAGNNLNVNADATSDFTSRTSLKAPEASAMAVAVNVTEFNSNANVNINTDLKAENDLNVNAENIITDDNVNAESTIGSGKYMSAATQIVTGHVEQKKGEVKDWIGTLAGKLSSKLGEKLSSTDETIEGLQLSEIFKAGATVTYSGQAHGSSVTIGENASLNAGGKMDIDALTKIEDAHITATGTTSSYNDAYPAEATLNAAVLVNNMDNSSSVVVEDAVTDENGTEHKATLSAADGVDINASTRFEYNRIANMIQDVKDAAAQIKNAVSGLDGAIKSDFDGFLTNLNTQIGAWESAFATADETLATSDSGVLAIGEAVTAGIEVLTALNNLNTMLDSNEGSQVAADVKATIQGASDMLTGALAFADPNSYGNFAAASASKGSSGDTSDIAGHHPSAINGAGTVMVNNIDSVSKVEIGSNSVIESNGKVNLNAENYMKDVSLGGLNTVPLTNSGGGTVASIGATVNYSDFNTDTIVAVNDGASISGGDINIAGSNEIDHVSVAGGAGKGPSDETGSNGIVLNGMISLVNGSSDILTVVDDGASLTAEPKQYTETVEDGSTEETKTSTGNISISGHNDTNIVNVAAGLNLGSGSGAIGMGLAYNDFAVKNIAGVADVSEQINALYTTKEHYTDDNGEDAVKYVVDENKVKELNDKLSNNYTASKADNGSISAYGFNVDAATEGSIQSVSVAASASKNDDTGETSFFGKIKGGISNLENNLLGTGGKLDTVTGKIFGTESGKANDFFNMGKNTHGANGDDIKLVGDTNGKGGFMPSFSIAGSGSVSMNMLDNATQAIVDNAKITIMNNNGDINVTARDVSYAGAYSGAAALQWKSGGSASDKSVGFSGAAGVNDITNKVNAAIKNSIIKNADEVNTMALSGGEQLALGLGLNVAKSGNTSGYSGNAAVSVNLIDHDVEALHENNTVQDTGNINVAAYARDIENTGGGSLSAGQQKVGIGASVGVAMLNNNISAGIKGGSYTNVGSIEVDALNALKNVTVGVAAGLSVASGSGTGATVEGAGVYNEVHNTTNAFIEGSSDDNKVVISIDGDRTVKVNAQDIVDKDGTYEKILTQGITDGVSDLADGEAEIKNRMGEGFDITGKNELNDIDMSDAVNELNKDKQDNEEKETANLYKDGGSSIITVAAGLAGSTNKGAGGAAVAITDIENTYTAKIDYADIMAKTVSADAGSDSNIVTVAGGIAAASKGSGVGSVSWNDVVNTANVDILNSTVKAQSTTAKANNTAQIVSVGGQISGAGKAAIGATLSYVGLDNSTEVNITNTDFDKRAETDAEGTSVTAEATNRSDSYNIGAGVSGAGTAAVSGIVVVTQTKGNAGAVMDNVTINNAKSVTAKALDDTDILSVIGSINASGKVAAGAGVAYTEIGDVSTDTENGQHVTAEINNSEINSASAGSTVSANAEDTARVYNIAIGVGGAGNVAVQGASATTLINKETSAGINNTDIDADQNDSTKANVTVDAQNSSEITSSADVAAAAGSGAGVGAGIAVNRIIQQTNASVNGGQMNVNNLTVNANATPRIENIGVGIGVAGTGAGVTGSVAVNMIENDVTAHIGSGANIVADDNIGVVATSDEQIANYVGSASVAGTGAAVGLSVSVNQIEGETSAIIDGDNTVVSASGNGDALKVNDTVDDSKILDNFVDEDLFESQDGLANDRTGSDYKGVAVSASSTHAIKSFLINGGVAGTGAAVNGTVNVNMINGLTKAAINGADINKNVANAGDVNVIAHDYTNSAGLVGSASVAGTGAGVGLGSDTNTVSREVMAEVVGRTDSDGNADSVINAGALNVEADAQQGISSLTIGLGAAGIGAGVSNATSVALLNGKTTAKVNNANITANKVNIAANHTGKLSTLGAVLGAGGVGAGVGIGVSVLNENSETAAETVNSNITINDGAQEDRDVNINAANNTKVNYQLYSTGGALAGVAGSIGVSNVNSKVNTTVTGTVIGTTDKANDINIGAENNIDFTNNSGSVAGGAVGVGVGVAVNTIDSQVNTSVGGSELNAFNDINVTAKENRTVNQMAVNAGAGAATGGANVMITNIGSVVADTYGDGLQTDDDGNVVEGSGVNIDDILDEANEAVEGNKLKDGYTMGVDVNAVPKVTAGKGATAEADKSVVKVNIDNTTLNAGSKVTADAVADTNVSMDAIQAGVGAFANVSGTVGILDVNRNSIVNISGSDITAKDLAVNTTQKGTSELDIYQGSIGGLASIGAAYGSATSTGVNNISVSGSTLNIGNDININAKDESKTDVNAIGVSVSGGAASVIVAEGTNNSKTSIIINDADLKAGNDVTIHTERQAKDESGNKADSLRVSAIAASGGLVFAGAGVAAIANEMGTVGAEVTGGSNFNAGDNIAITALNAPSVSAETGAVSGSMLASAAITVAEANIGGENEDEHLKTIVNISDDNSFTADSLTAEAKADAEQKVDMNGISLAAGLWPTGAVQANTGAAKAYSDVTVSIGKNVFKGNEDNGIALNINGVNDITRNATAKGISVSTFVASGTNIAETASILNTQVSVGDASGSDIEKADIKAESSVDVTNTARGDGGAIADISPYAAKTANKINSTTNVNVSGNWNVAGDMNVEALHTNNVTLNTDALKASVVGLSGVHSDNDITNNTGVTFSGATVTTGGSQDISARNDIDYTADITGSGYGVAQGAAVWAEDNITLNAGVKVENSTLDAKGSIDINALTGDADYNGINKPNATVDKEVTIKSAGVVAGTYAKSTDEVTFTNNITVGSGSSVITSGTNIDNADITMTAADRTNFNDIVTADTQGGAIGAAGTTLKNTINRNNSIKVGGNVDSNYDANFDAGNSSALNLTLKSNAYNKTAAPLATIPSIEGTVSPTSTITFETGSTVKSLRDINAAADEGDLTIAKESKTWRWVDGGETGTGSIASTSDGTLSGEDADINTSVTVNGTLEAGKNHELNITIGYADEGKKNLEEAIKKYGEGLKLSDLGAALEKAQENYNNSQDVKDLQQAVKELNEANAKQENNNIIKDMLQGQIDGLEIEEAAAETVKTNAQNALNQYITDSLDAYNGTLGEDVAKVTRDDFVAALEKNDISKPWYSEYSVEYTKKNTALSKASSKVNAIQAEIEAKIAERNGYTDHSTRINELETQITELKNKTKNLEDAIKAAQENYDKALREGITEELVNDAIFNGHIGDKNDSYVTVDVPEWYEEQYGSAAEKIGMIDYAASQLERMQELIDMSQEYSGTDVGTAYSNELKRIQGELQALGLLTLDSEGNYGIAEGASTVPTIELKDLMVSGGNVNISGDELTGSGNITAHGDPSVTITNNTDFFLRVNDITVDSDGGKVSHNDVSINPDSEASRYNGIGIAAGQGDSANGNNAQITIHNTTNTKASESTLYTPDIGIYGEIYNPYGNVKIINDNNSIYVAGEVIDSAGNITQEAGSIKGRTINLTAGGSVTQGYTDEIYNVAGNPENALDPDYISAIQDALIEALGNNKDGEGKYYAAFDTDTELAKFLTGLTVNGNELDADEALQAAKLLTGQVESDKPGIAAGGAIYINAASINVNGTIQSGFEDYKLDINQERIQSLMSGYNKGAVEKPDSDYMNEKYLVTNGSTGAYYDSEKGEFVYGVQAWYNPTTNQIFTEDIEQAGGGRIYLTGAIVNTNANGGKLVVLDGGANYTINGTVNETNDFTFKLGSINAETVQGRIEINDTNTGNTVIYGRDSIITKDKNGDVISDGKNTATKYNPLTGQYYNWSNGTSNRVTTSYKHVSDSSWFGLSNDNWEDIISQLDQATKDQMKDGDIVITNGEQLGMGNIITDGSVNGYTNLGASGSGTSAVDGGTTKKDNTLYQILFERKGKPKQGTNDKGELLYTTAEGELTTVAEGNTPYYLKDADGNYIYETEISERTTTTKKKGLFGLWGKTVTTTWKETSGMITAYNFGLKADNPINIEFVGNEAGSTGTITSNGNILLGGDINMGKVDIISTAGNISHLDDATVISDNATFNAQTGIDVIQKNANDALHLNATTVKGDINIQALAGNANNMVYIDNVSTAGNVNITAEGDLLNGTLGEGQTVVLTGNGITLQSYGGSIGAEDSLLAINAKSSVNAYADKSVYLSETEGNMYLGEVVAGTGDVVLEVKGNGAGFVDAIVGNSEASNTDEERIEAWKDLGLLSSGEDDAANSRENQIANLENAAGSFFVDEDTNLTAAQAKGAELVAKGKKFAELMQGGADEVKAAKADLDAKQGALNEAVANLGDDADSKAAYKTALEAYNAAYDNYETVGAQYEQDKANFIANSGYAGNQGAVDWLYNYEAISNAADDNYGWTEQQLLYAVQDTVINPEAGSIGDVKTANVTGNNITFISDTGNIGVVDEQLTEIKTDTLAEMFTKGELTEDEKTLLDKLAAARAGDVTWGDENITIKRTTPVSVKLNGDGGKVTVKDTSTGDIADHIYLLAKDSVLNADEFAANDLRLSGQEGINVNKVTGDKIYLEGGSGDIGSGVGETLKAMQVTLTNNGFINANTAGKVMLKQVDGNENFTLGSIAGTAVDITARGNIVSKTDDIGYINASEAINLTSGGGIGTEDAGLRIKNSGAVVNTNAQSAINIEAKQDGTLVLGKMEQTSGGVNVESEGSLYIGREKADGQEAVEGYIDAKDDVNLHTADDIIISGMLHVNKTDDTDSNLKLHSDAGDIIQTTDSAAENIEANNIELAAVGGSVELANEHNKIDNADIAVVGGSLAMTVSNPDGFNVDLGGFSNKRGGDVEFTNNGGSINITTKDIVDENEKDPAEINGSLIVTTKGSENKQADINNDGILNADENITFNAADNVYNNETVTAGETIEFTAVDGVINSNTVDGKDVIMHAIEQELANIIAKDSVTMNGDRINAHNITQHADADGDLIINTDSNSGSGPIESLVVDKVDANDKSVFTDLWAVTADITTVDKKMDFDKILIEEMAWLKNTGTLATVYGNVPVKDNDANVHIYQAYPSMFINFVDTDTVESDGRLLSLDNYWYAYDQRFTAEDHLRYQHGRYLDEDYKQAYGYGVSLHNRYGLIDYQDFTEENAGEDEIAVEA